MSKCSLFLYQCYINRDVLGFFISFVYLEAEVEIWTLHLKFCLCIQGSVCVCVFAYASLFGTSEIQGNGLAGKKVGMVI